MLHAPSSRGDSIEPRSVIVKNTIESGDVLFRHICYDGWEPPSIRFELEVTIRDVQEDRCHFIAELVNNEDNSVKGRTNVKREST